MSPVAKDVPVVVAVHDCTELDRLQLVTLE
jgi:hypothetical protein